jgi:type II secretory pathway component PulJ
VEQLTMKRLHNEKGFTVAELLAAITIATLILGIASTLFLSIYQLFQSNAQSSADNSAMKLTMNTLATQLVDSNQVVFYSSNKELRYKSGQGYKTVIFDTPANRLTLYDFSNDGNNSNNDTQFRSAAINLSNNSSLYTRAIVLANNVERAEFNQTNGTLIPAAPLTDGQLITLKITFNYTKISILGARSVVTQVKEIQVKLLKDHTLK